MKTGWLRLFLALALGSSFVLQSGCTYLTKRGNDAADIVNLGITVTPRLKPEFAFYFDFFSLTPIGYANLDNKMFGIFNRNYGLMDYEEESYGAVVYGREMKVAGEFNPKDPHQAHTDQTDVKERPKFDIGLGGITSGENPPPPLHYLECDRAVHLGWIGIRNTMRPFDLVDFVLGWTGLDIMGDDNIAADSVAKE